MKVLCCLLMLTATAVAFELGYNEYDVITRDYEITEIEITIDGEEFCCWPIKGTAGGVKIIHDGKVFECLPAPKD